MAFIGPLDISDTTKQPQFVPRINWMNPSSRGLIGAFLPGYPINIVDGVAMYTDFIPPTVQIRPGIGGKSLKGGMYTYQPPSVTYPYGSRFDLTIGSALIVASQDSEQNANIGIGRASTAGSQNWGIGLHSGSVDGAYGIWGTFASPLANHGTTLQKRTVAITANGTTATLYYDANVVASGVYTMTAYDSSFRNRCFGFGSSDQGQDVSTATIATSVGFVWNRPLSAEEVTRLTQNPWQLFLSAKSIFITSLNQRTPWQQRESTILGTSSTMSNKSAIITSFKSVRTSQPQGLPIINWENSITDKLATAFIPSYGPNGRIFDAVTRLFDTGIGSTFGVGKLGYYNTPVSNISIGNPSGRIPKYRPPSSYPGITTFTVFEIPTTGGNQTMLGGGVSSTVYNKFTKNNDNSISYTYNSNSGGFITSSPLNLNTLYYAVGKQRFGTNYRELYINKELIGVDTSTQTNINSSYTFAGITTTGGGASTRIYCSYVWLRELSVQEIYSLTDNPWQIFRPPTRLIGGAR